MLSSNSQLSVGQFFSNSYKVPEYQRDYAWEAGEIDDLLEDISSLDRGDLSDLFLGQIVICDSKGEKAIVDGQQRITSLWLIYLAIRNTGKDINSQYGADDFSVSDIDSLLGTTRKDRQKDKLVLGDRDREFFHNLSYMESSEIPEKLARNQRKAQKNLINNYWRIQEKIKEWIEDYPSYSEKVDKLTKIQDMVSEHIVVLTITTSEETEAYIIFETLNARGRDLATADLLKNYLFKTSGTNIDAVKRNWGEMADALGNADPTKYIRSLWNSRHESICREKLLNKALKKECITPKDCLELTNNLKKYASLYCFLVDPENASTPDIHSECFTEQNKRRYQTLARLRVKTYYPVLLSFFGTQGFETHEAKGFEKLLVALETVVVRNLVIGEENPNSLEIQFATIACRIYGQLITTVDETVEEILDLSISDESFESKLYDFIPSSNTLYKARFLLRGIAVAGKKEQYLGDNKEVHIEHIMPVSNEKWKVDAETHENYLWRLGNLTLLGSEYNIDAQNDIFEEKKKNYSKSDINITKALCDYSEWTPATIEEREEKLLKSIKEIWSLNSAK